MSERRRLPTEADAMAIAADVTGRPPVGATRFAVGSGSFVYDVGWPDGARVVVRIAPPDAPNVARAAAHWSRALRPLGVPLPALIAERVDPGGLSWVVLERLPGRDLELVYATLTPDQKRALAADVVRVRQLVEALPEGRGFGFVALPGRWPHPTWTAAVREMLRRSRSRIEHAGAVDPRHVARVESLLPAFEPYLASVRPTPFLDDTTTRNVIVHDGRLSGIVDVDCLCYGDPLLTPALTRMALLSRGYDTLYVDFWLDRVGATDAQRRAVRFYTAVYCLDFMGELGQQFNRAAPAPVEPEDVTRLEALLETLLSDL